MYDFELTILGSNSALPAYGRFPTCQILRFKRSCFLIDCGEGAQIRMNDYKIKRNKITHVFISHFHGDHLYGLPGVIGSMNHMGRKEPLTVFGPAGLKKYLDVINEIGEVHLNFDLKIIEIHNSELTEVYSDEEITVSAFPVFHRIPTFGYLFKEKQRTLNIKKSAIDKYSLTVDEIIRIKEGHSVKRDDELIPLSELVLKIKKPRSYAYCADSRPDPSLVPIIHKASLLYFETTYLDDLREQADERGHATSIQAAELAKAAGVGALVTGHYSSRYKNVNPFKEEAQTIFENVILGYDGLTIPIK